MVEDSIQQRLLEAAIHLFGQHGLNGIGTRAIADAAGVQMSAITYHFGGKEGLHLACAKHIAEEMLRRVSPVLARVRAACPDEGAGAADARAAVVTMLSGLVSIMMQDDIAPLARFVVVEQMNPTPAFAVLYEGTIRRVLDRMSELVQRVAGGRLAAEEARLRSFVLMGPIFATRFARAGLMRLTGWQSVGAEQTAAVNAVVVAHANAILGELQRSAA